MLLLAVPIFLVSNCLEILAVKVLGRLGVRLPQLVAVLHCCGSVFTGSRAAILEGSVLLRCPICVGLGVLTAAHALLSAVALTKLPGYLYTLIKVCEIPMSVAARAVVMGTRPKRLEVGLSAVSAFGASLLLFQSSIRSHNNAGGRSGSTSVSEADETISVAALLAAASSAISCFLPVLAEWQLRRNVGRHLGAQSFAVSIWAAALCLSFAVIDGSEIVAWAPAFWQPPPLIVGAAASAGKDLDRCSVFGGLPLTVPLLFVVALGQHCVRLAREVIVLAHSSTLFSMLKPLRQVVIVPLLVILLGREAELPGMSAVPAYGACVAVAVAMATKGATPTAQPAAPPSVMALLGDTRFSMLVVGVAVAFSAISLGGRC
eukprot:TRINITY_DN36770_c0_g1_i1.p1 TRINITY_DN36770_c0_g1~~TRINITY_DN36770_c0_g1_i1.p1  ORF type:complete len:375 (+),score=52.34 TRINITY_DN36770_c0_g1_i1:105-1229(+)